MPGYDASITSSYPDQLQQVIKGLEKKRDAVLAEYKRLKLPLDQKASYEELAKVRAEVELLKATATEDARNIIAQAKGKESLIIEESLTQANKVKEEANRFLASAKDTMAKAIDKEEEVAAKKVELRVEREVFEQERAAFVEKKKVFSQKIDEIISSLGEYK